MTTHEVSRHAKELPVKNVVFHMETFLRYSSYLSILILLGLVVFSEGCSKDSDCNAGFYCCLSHCTSREIRCSELCTIDQDCKRNQLCHQGVCSQCSGRFSCDLKSCYNDTDCPSDYKCGENRMCGKNTVPKRHTFSLLPFIIIIGVLGFALIILCYTEGCWKELFVHFKRHWGRYGTVALDEVEADRREGENESITHSHSNKSGVNNVHRENTRSSTISSNSSPLRPTTTSLNNSPQSLRNTRVVSQHSRTLVMAISQATRNQTRSTSHSNSSSNTDVITNERVDSGSQPLLASSPSSNGNSTEESPPTYLSLFNEEFEEPPPKYEDVVHVQVPVNIEMRRVVVHGSNRSLRSQDNSEVETMV